jgi:hypothetical protein
LVVPLLAQRALCKPFVNISLEEEEDDKRGRRGTEAAAAAAAPPPPSSCIGAEAIPD